MNSAVDFAIILDYNHCPGGATIKNYAREIARQWEALPAEQRPQFVRVDTVGLGFAFADLLRELGLPVQPA